MLKWHGDRVLSGIEKRTDNVKAKSAEAIAERARFLVPVVTGHLRSKIKAGADFVEVDADYAAAVELGTSVRAAKPFVRPAIEQAKETDVFN